MTRSPLRILAIEDNPADLFILEEAIKESGYSCELSFVESHAEAASLLSQQTFQLILSDFGSRRKEAADFIQLARIVAPRVPIVILSGSPDPNVAYDAGANAFVRKVADLTQFYAKIRSLLHFWVDVAELPLPQESRAVKIPLSLAATLTKEKI